MRAPYDRAQPPARPGSSRSRPEHERRARRQLARRRAIRRRRGVAGVLVSALVVVIVLLGLGGAPARHPAVAITRDAPAHHVARPATVHASRPATVHASRPAPSPGSLPQTHAYPSGTSPQFRALMADLWAGVVDDSLARGLLAFFPQGAYVQLKSIGDAAGDWTNRLVRDFRLDIGAAHALLGADARNARLLRVDVVSSYGHWVPPGVCDNSIGYYEMPNARVVYREAGQTRSFGIASMISWRGVWYVVHFGAILRSTDTGALDAPASGPGTSLYSGTC
jgi:hypothetical protein